MRIYFGGRLSVPLALALALASAASASDLTQVQAIAVAKNATAKQCSEATPCTYEARREGARWYVFVQFTKRNSPAEPPLTYPGGREIIVVDDRGRVVETMPGE